MTDALGILLIAEHAALLSGRDDEFVAVVLKGFVVLDRLLEARRKEVGE